LGPVRAARAAGAVRAGGGVSVVGVGAGLVVADPGGPLFGEVVRAAEVFPVVAGRLRVFVDEWDVGEGGEGAVAAIAEAVGSRADRGVPVDVISCGFAAGPVGAAAGVDGVWGSKAAVLSRHPLLRGVPVVAATATVWTIAAGGNAFVGTARLGADARVRIRPGGGLFYQFRTVSVPGGDVQTLVEPLDVALPGTRLPDPGELLRAESMLDAVRGDTLTEDVILPPGSRRDQTRAHVYWVGAEPADRLRDDVLVAANGLDAPVIFLGAAKDAEE